MAVMQQKLRHNNIHGALGAERGYQGSTSCQQTAQRQTSRNSCGSTTKITPEPLTGVDHGWPHQGVVPLPRPSHPTLGKGGQCPGRSKEDHRKGSGSTSMHEGDPRVHRRREALIPMDASRNNYDGEVA